MLSMNDPRVEPLNDFIRIRKKGIERVGVYGRFTLHTQNNFYVSFWGISYPVQGSPTRTVSYYRH